MVVAQLPVVEGLGLLLLRVEGEGLGVASRDWRVRYRTPKRGLQ